MSGEIFTMLPRVERWRAGHLSWQAGPEGRNPAEYPEDTARFFAANAFHEVEIARRINRFGNLAHMGSAYEARHAPDDAQPERRGVNSIQRFADEHGHWQIIAMIWDNEREGVGIDASQFRSKA